MNRRTRIAVLGTTLFLTAGLTGAAASAPASHAKPMRVTTEDLGRRDLPRCVRSAPFEKVWQPDF
jgi:hypothetical protein